MTGKRVKRWRYTSPKGNRLLVTERPGDSGVHVGIPTAVTLRWWPQLPELPPELEARVRAVNIGELSRGGQVV